MPRIWFCHSKVRGQRYRKLWICICLLPVEEPDGITGGGWGGARIPLIMEGAVARQRSRVRGPQETQESLNQHGGERREGQGCLRFALPAFRLVGTREMGIRHPDRLVVHAGSPSSPALQLAAPESLRGVKTETGMKLTSSSQKYRRSRQNLNCLRLRICLLRVFPLARKRGICARGIVESVETNGPFVLTFGPQTFGKTSREAQFNEPGTKDPGGSSL